MECQKGRRAQRKVVILLDYENISIEVTSQSKLLDLRGTIDFCVKNIGPVIASFAFVPVSAHIKDVVKWCYEAGFFPVLCPKIQNEKVVKDKDKTDSIMIDFAERMLDENHEVTDVAILTHDGDFVPLVNFLRSRGKHVLLGTLGKISQDLRSIVGHESIFDVPTKSL